MWEYFKIEEFNCKHCDANIMDISFVDMLDEMRHLHGKPIIISSGYRCPTYNCQISSTGIDGPHTTGQAADIAVARGDAYQILKIAFELGFTGIGVHQKGDSRFIHLDNISTGARPTVWSY